MGNVIRPAITSFITILKSTYKAFLYDGICAEEVKKMLKYSKLSEQTTLAL